MATKVNRGAVGAKDSEQQPLDQIEHLLSAPNDAGAIRLVGPQGQDVTLPHSLLTVLRDAAHQLARRKLVTVVPLNRDLTTYEAAALLNVSRPYLIRLLDQGAIPFTRTGTHRRIGYDDLMRYKSARDTAREQALDELTRLNQEMGLYNS
jgi:excisionase family DNA binding protein